MSFNVDWDIDKYRDAHESEDHWQLRRAFMAKWKNEYPEERLVCLARVFTNIELLGCRYPPQVMNETSRLSQEVAQSYRQLKKTKLQRTFVSASVAAENKVKSIKRKSDYIMDGTPEVVKVQFVEPGAKIDREENDNESDTEDIKTDNRIESNETEINTSENEVCKQRRDLLNEYLDDLNKLNCVDVRRFRDEMYDSIYGRMVLYVRPWATKLWNIQASCQICKMKLDLKYDNGRMTLSINDRIVCQANADSKAEARGIVENIAWEVLKSEVVILLVKEQFRAQNDTRISVQDVSMKKVRDDQFGAPVETSVAVKMMQMMGWDGGGLGAEAQGIVEPIKPNLQMVNRAGLGSTTSDIRQLRKAAFTLMQRYITSGSLDVDLVFSSDFSKEERALLHNCAQKLGLASRSYGANKDRFLVVNKKLNPYSLVREVIANGGSTAKYQVFISEEIMGNINGSSSECVPGAPGHGRGSGRGRWMRS